jgi:hypothetical protein
MRTVCGCWAHADETKTDETKTDAAKTKTTAIDATRARGIHEKIFGMVFPSKGFG